MSLASSSGTALTAQGAHAGGRLPAIAECLRGLRSLCAVARHGSVTRAAEAMCLSQASVTRAISELETACGLRLFDRGPRGMSPTVVGSSVAKRAHVLFEHLARGAQEAKAHAAPRARRAIDPQRFAAVVSTASLKAFLAIAITGSETRAAEHLGLSQPTVHRALRHIQHRVGVPLLQRSIHGTRLTEAGEALLLCTKLAMAEARAIESEMAAWQGRLRGHVIIGSIPFSGTALLTRTLEALRRDRPDMSVTVVEGAYESLTRKLHEADIDVVIGALRESPQAIRQEVFYSEPLVVIVRANHPCLAMAAPTLADLQTWEWVMPLPGAPANELLYAAHAACGVAAPRAAVHSNSPMFTRSMLANNDLLAVAPFGQSLEDEASGLFRRVAVALPGSARAIGATVREIGQPSPDLLAVLEAMRTAAAQTPVDAARSRAKVVVRQAQPPAGLHRRAGAQQ